MKLDQTFIAIRERGILEICDLALHVVREHVRPLLLLLLLGALPWVVIDWLLASWLLSPDWGDEFTPYFYWVMALLVTTQAQIATAFMTNYLGQAMFIGKPETRKAIKDCFSTPPYIYWSHGVLRMLFLVLLIVFWMRDASVRDLQANCFFFLPAAVLIAMLVRGFRPFVTEIMILEKTPIKVKRGQESKITFGKRSKSLHAPVSSDLFGRMVTTCLFLCPLTLSFYLTFVTMDSILNLQANSELSLYPFYWVLALWLTAGFSAVIRFLSYVDIRIRQEGWAVELRMRAEGLRVAQTMD